MKHWLGLATRHWWVCFGFFLPLACYPGPDTMYWEQQEQPDRSYPPPVRGPERVAGQRLSPVERELWECIQGQHGDCAAERLS
jgi:hypothetical protein